MLKINLGCGATPTPGWLNFDNSPFCRLASFPAVLRLLAPYAGPHRQPFLDLIQRRNVLYADAAKRIPVPDQSVRAIYTSHMIDQVAPGKLPRFFHELRRVLVPGGYLRIGVTDLRLLAERYVAGTIDADAFVQVSDLAVVEPDTLLTRLKFLFFGLRTYRVWMYDGASLVSLLQRFGFIEATVLPAGQTSIPDPGALRLDERSAETVYVEARKP